MEKSKVNLYRVPNKGQFVTICTLSYGTSLHVYSIIRRIGIRKKTPLIFVRIFT